LKANGVLRFLDETNDYNIITNEDKEVIASLKSEIERLNNEYNQSEDVRTDLLDSISELEDELEGYSEYIDVYSLIPITYDYYGLSQFELITDGRTYAAGTQREMEDAVIDHVNQLIDDVGYEGFSKSFVENNVDADMVADHFRDFWEEDINNSPDSYFDDESRMLSDGQNDQISHMKKQIQYYRTVIQTLEARLDDEEEDEITSKIEEFESNIEELESEIEEIESDPEGDFPQDLIDEKVEEMIEDVRSSPLYYIREHGMDIEDFINKSDFVDAVIDEDGWGVLCPYDGNYEEYNINDNSIYVFRID
jgi:predicted  nucleic acid-binding Zn-ribbon protein